MRWQRLLVLAACFALAPAIAWSAPACQDVAPRQDGWTVARPQDHGLDAEAICAIADRLATLRAPMRTGW